MSPRPTNEEIFSDLDGTPETALPEGEAAQLEQRLVALGQTDNIKDEDLEVEVADDEEEGDGEDADQEEDDEEEEADEGATAGASDFDPKDVQLLVKDAELLDEKEKTAKANVTQATADIASARARMLKAKEDGDSEGDVKATEDFSKATVALERANGDVANVTQAKEGLKSRAQELYAKAPKDDKGNPILDGTGTVQRRQNSQTQAADRPSKLVPKFKAANPWFGNAKYAAQQKRLLQLDKGLAAEGVLNKDDPAYFVELGKRFNREYPGLYKTTDGKPIATGQRQRQNGAQIPNGGGGGGGAPPGPASKIKLVPADLDQMRVYGMDPENMEHRKTWLAEKRAGARAA